MIDTDEAELDAMLAAVPVAPPTLNGAKGLPRRCKTGQHQWTTREVPQHGFAIEGNGMASAFETTCDRCHIVRNEAQSAMGRKVNQRSRREERRLAALYQGRRTGHHGGPDDVQTDMTNIQSKAGDGVVVQTLLGRTPKVAEDRRARPCSDRVQRGTRPQRPPLCGRGRAGLPVPVR
jgi:hypothetical protein